VIKDKEDQVY